MKCRPVAARGPQSTWGPDPVPANHCFYHTRRIWRARYSPLGVHLAKFYLFREKSFPLWPLSERLFLIGNYVYVPTFSHHVGAAHSLPGILSNIAIGCNKLHSLQQSNSTDTADQSSKAHRPQPLHTQVPKLTGRSLEPFSGVEIHMEMNMEWKWMEMGGGQFVKMLWIGLDLREGIRSKRYDRYRNFIKHDISKTEARLYPKNTAVIEKDVPKLKH